MASVSFENVVKQFGDVKAVNNLNIHVADKEFLVLVGPSGCGKTTALRSLAGLEEITSGNIKIGDRIVNDVAPKDRDIAMVFQSYALYPHLSVYDNMAFGLKLRKVPKEEIKRRVSEAADILGIQELLQRKPRQLSGGQRQRVAVGRAIVREPKVFLFDEPLSNLDAKLRVAMRAEISKLHQRLQTTFIYVTHDQTEAMTMATRIAVINKGVLQQLDTPQNLYDRPNNLFVAGFIGSPAMNFFPAKLRKENGKLVVDAGDFAVNIPPSRAKPYEVEAGKDIIFGIRPENIHDAEYVPTNIDAEKVAVKVDVTELMGNEIFLYLVSGKNTFVARVDPRSKLRVGEQATVAFDMDNIHIFDAATEEAIR
jgi:multiple sugar transport system ATP-binding protein